MFVCMTYFRIEVLNIISIWANGSLLASLIIIIEVEDALNQKMLFYAGKRLPPTQSYEENFNYWNMTYVLIQRLWKQW